MRTQLKHIQAKIKPKKCFAVLLVALIATCFICDFTEDISEELIREVYSL